MSGPASHRLCIAARDAGAGTGLRDSVAVGALLPLSAGSGGKVLLAWSAGAAELPASQQAELAAVRSRGWAASVAEREPGVASVSAPVLRDGVLLGAVCVSGPVSRLGQAPGRKLSAQVDRSGCRASSRLSCRVARTVARRACLYTTYKMYTGAWQ